MINTDNYELYFFQYQEGMLNEADCREVEDFAAQHPELSEELALYAEAPVLTAQEVAYPYKECLYRKEPVAFRGWRYAAAVAMGLATTLMLTIHTQNHPAGTPPIACAESTDISNLQPRPIGSIREEARMSKASASMPESVLEPEVPVPSDGSEWEYASVEVIDTQQVESNCCDLQMLAQTAEPTVMPAAIEQQMPEVVIHDYADTSWGLLIAAKLVERYPEEAMQLTMLTARIVIVLEQIQSNKVITTIQSII